MGLLLQWSLHLCRHPPFFRPKSARWLDNLPSKSPPMADLHHADVITHTTPITATSSLNCAQYPTESKCNGLLLRHLEPTPKLTIYYILLVNKHGHLLKFISLPLHTYLQQILSQTLICNSMKVFYCFHGATPLLIGLLLHFTVLFVCTSCVYVVLGA